MITMKAAIPIAHNATLGDLRRGLVAIPDRAQIDVYVSKGDRPWESDSAELRATWTNETTDDITDCACQANDHKETP